MWANPGGASTPSSSSSNSTVTGRPPKVSLFSGTPPWRSILQTKEKAPNGLHSKALAAKMAASRVSGKTEDPATPATEPCGPALSGSSGHDFAVTSSGVTAATLVLSTLARVAATLLVIMTPTRSISIGLTPFSFLVDLTVIHHALSAIWIGKRILPFTTYEFLAPKTVRQPRSCIEKQLRTLKSISAITTFPKLIFSFPIRTSRSQIPCTGIGIPLAPVKVVVPWCWRTTR